jgi:hypothetical protein
MLCYMCHTDVDTWITYTYLKCKTLLYICTLSNIYILLCVATYESYISSITLLVVEIQLAVTCLSNKLCGLQEGRTALHYCGASPDPPAMWSLLESAGVDSEVVDRRGNRARHYMPKSSHLTSSRMGVTQAAAQAAAGQYYGIRIIIIGLPFVINRMVLVFPVILSGIDV